MFVLARRGNRQWMLACEIKPACEVMGAIHTKDNRARVKACEVVLVCEVMFPCVSARGAHEATANVTHLCRRAGRVGRMRRQQVSHIRVGARGARGA